MQGLLLALAAYTIWGCFPLFFNLLSQVPSFEVLVHRIIWSFVATTIVILMLRRLSTLTTLLRDKRALGWLMLSSLLIATNWLIFIWAVSQQRVLESSLGYFMTPLVSLFLGRIILKESMHPLQAIAGALAAVAVLLELIMLGKLPWISLTLALSFGFYGLVRKQQPVDSLNGLTVETLLILPLALGWILWQLQTGRSMAFFSGNTLSTSLMIMSGIVTAVPLLLFAAAAKRLDLSVVGFIMYLNPTLQFLIAVFIFNESYPPQRLITFILIWIAMGFFLYGLWQSRKSTKMRDISEGKI
ncbi:EamA family transporter RarD [Nitrincola alkalilacustris]|uniref:EamA family transporter RarD n=1 Tax=Nitrincola alkalilacustris TaxID=1571224 RepID=UPI00124D5970|nr:EamA family transporter RarD [Nitrincola alkalilacustris]